MSNQPITRWVARGVGGPRSCSWAVSRAQAAGGPGHRWSARGQPAVRHRDRADPGAQTGVGRPRTRPDRVLADKAYSSKANRTYLRRRGIKATIPIKDDQATNRRKPGSNGGRPPTFDKQIYRHRHALECGINNSRTIGRWPLASTSSPRATKPPSRSQRSTSGSDRRPDCHALSATARAADWLLSGSQHGQGL
jgi:Transposase DDE domain